MLPKVAIEVAKTAIKTAIVRLKAPVIAAATAVVMAASPSAMAVDLVEVYQQALLGDASFASAKQNLEAAKLDLPLARSAFGPFLSATGGLSTNYANVDREGASGNSFSYNQGQLGLNASKKLRDPLASLDIESADIAQQGALLNYAIEEQALIQRSIARYLAVLAAIDNEILAQRELDALEKQLDLSTQRLDVGLGTRTDQYDAIARYELSKATLISAQNQVIDAIQSLEELTGSVDRYQIDDFATLADGELPFEIDLSSQQLLESTANNKTLQLAQLRLFSAQIDEEKTQKLNSISFGLVGGWSYDDTSADASGIGTTRDGWQAGLSANYPLYQAGSVKTRQEQAGYRLNAARLESEQTRREVSRSLRTAQRAVQSNHRQVEALAQAVVASENALVSKQEGFRAGVTTNLDVLDGQRDLFRARRDYLQARYSVINAVVDLELAAGSLTVEDVVNINNRLVN